MKPRLTAVLFGLFWAWANLEADPLGTAFTYQGHLADGGAPAHGSYDLQFTLHDALSGGAQIGSPLTTNGVGVIQGLMTVTLDFDRVFDGNARWLAIAVKTNGAAAYTPLTPRQPLTPVPYAIYATNAGWAATAATAATATTAGTAATAGSATSANTAVSFSGPLTGDVTGRQNTTTVERLRGKPVASTAPSAGQHLRFDGSQWTPAAVALDTDVGGTLADVRLSTNVALLNTNQVFTGSNRFSGVLKATNVDNVLVGQFTGSGAGLTSLAGSQITGTVPATSIADNSITAAKIAGGNVVKTLNLLKDDVTLAAGTNLTLTPGGQTLTLASPTDWHVRGNAGTTPGVDFLGTTDSQPLELWVNNSRALRLEPGVYGVPNVIGGGANQANLTYGTAIGGGWGNTIQTNTGHATIAGGTQNTIGTNSLFSAIGGGTQNAIGPSDNASTIAGGNSNIVQQSNARAVIGGGYQNTIIATNWYPTIGGGEWNSIGTYAVSATIAGGQNNSILTYAQYATIGGGYANTNQGPFSTIPGGNLNAALGGFSFAAGNRAKANHNGAFVWGDSTAADFSSTGPDQFLIRAKGGVGIGTNNPQSALHVAGTVKAEGFIGSGAALTSLSGTALADSSVTAAKLAPGAVNHLDAPDGSPLAAVQVNTNGLVGIGTNVPAAGLDIQTSGMGNGLEPAFQVRQGEQGYNNILAPMTVEAAGNLVAIGDWGLGGVTLVNASYAPFPTLLWQVQDGSGGFTNLLGLRGMALTNNLLVLAAERDDAVTLVSVTNPVAPIKLSELRDGVAGWNDLDGACAVALSGDLLAIAAADDNAVTLASLANRANPTQLKVFKQGSGGFANLVRPISVAISGNLLAIAASNAVTLVDISTPASPVLRATLVQSIGGYADLTGLRTVAISGSRLAIVAVDSGAVTLVDVSNPAFPVLRTVLKEIPGEAGLLKFAFSASFSGNRLAVASYQAVSLFDVSDLAHPQLLSAARGVGYPLIANRDVAFVGENLAVASEFPGAFTLLQPAPVASGLFSQGWVGIGTRHPVAALDVVGDVVIEEAERFSVSARHIALGRDSTATGDYGTVAIGESANASGNNAIAIGWAANASASTALAMGYGAQASGDYAVAIGSQSKASEEGAVAIGSGSDASGPYASALGQHAIATGSNATAIGYLARANGAHSTAIGVQPSATGVASVALGTNVWAKGTAALALGNGTEARGDSSTALGVATLAGGYGSTALGVSTAATNDYTLAAGRQAKAFHRGSFVWADSTAADFASAAADQFLIRAAGGVGLGTNRPQAALHVVGTVKADAFVGSGTAPASFPSLGVGTATPQDALLDVEGNIHLNDFDLFLRGGTDRNHGLGWYGVTKPFAGGTVDGPVLYGWTGGGLGSMTGGPRLALQWDATGSIAIDPGTLNAGGMTPGLVFGGLGSGEGIASKRTAGNNQFALNFYTGFENRMTILGNGDIGIGTPSPVRRLQVMDGSGPTHAGGSIQVGMASTGGDPKLVYFGDGDFVHVGENGADDTLELKASRFFFTGGNLGIDTNLPAYKIHLAGGAYCNGLQWVNASDRDRKEGFQTVRPDDILARVVALPLSTWSYKEDPASRHLGPTAQDFHAAFGFGADDKAIGTVDADGVALAAIQGLHEVVKEKDAEIQELKRAVAELKTVLNQVIAKQNGGKP